MFTALWSARTIPVKSAAVRATATDRTPMVSISRATMWMYERGRTRFRATWALRSPRPRTRSPPRARASGHTAPGSWLPPDSEALDEPPEVAAPGLEVVRGGHVEEVVHAAPVLHHHGLHGHAGAVPLPVHETPHGVSPADHGLLALHVRPVREAEEEMARQHAEGTPGRRPLAGRVRQHTAWRHAPALELDVRLRPGRHPPPVGGYPHLVSLPRVKHAPLDPVGAAARQEQQRARGNGHLHPPERPSTASGGRRP